MTKLDKASITKIVNGEKTLKKSYAKLAIELATLAHSSDRDAHVVQGVSLVQHLFVKLDLANSIYTKPLITMFGEYTPIKISGEKGARKVTTPAWTNEEKWDLDGMKSHDLYARKVTVKSEFDIDALTKLIHGKADVSKAEANKVTPTALMAANMLETFMGTPEFRRKLQQNLDKAERAEAA
tara:strand:- start:425 stop:970 length:546 start_codon:yes stop_codon:yes gene_type:complete